MYYFRLFILSIALIERFPRIQTFIINDNVSKRSISFNVTNKFFPLNIKVNQLLHKLKYILLNS